METMQISSVLTLFPETKSQQKSFVDRLVETVLEGDVDPLRVEAQMCNIEQIVKTYRKDERVKDILLQEAERYHKDELSNLYNSKFEIKEVGVKYDYSVCGHPEWEKLNEAINELTERKKNLEKELQLKRESFIYTDIETAEQTEVFPPERSSTTSVVVTVNK